MTDALQANLTARRREAGDFLRSRRERLTPAAVGLAEGVRRRTPGLRREEVAMLAGVGTTWYRDGSGNLNRYGEWSFCLTAARMAAEQERR